MTEVFSELANKIAQTMNFNYNIEEEYNVTQYLKSVHTMTTEK
jgi:hypothetical protein